LVADISTVVAEGERRRLIKRTQAGVELVQAQGKWLEIVSKVFTRDGSGYLQPVPNPDPEDGEVGYLESR
jgi:DNA invertase Pin-like site-specific DNA recombinase